MLRGSFSPERRRRVSSASGEPPPTASKAKTMNKEDAVLKINSTVFLLLPHTLLRSSSSRLRLRPAANLFTQRGRPAAARLAPASQN